jgi:hypothetical protein
MEQTMNIKFRRLWWEGLVMRMRKVGVPKEELKGYIDGRRTVGRPRGRWLVAVIRVDKRVLIWGNVRRSAEDREAWRRRIEPRRAVAP